MGAKTALLILVICVVFKRNSCAEFLKEKPEFLQSCQRKSPDFSQCMTKAFQHIFTDWKNGIAGIDNSKPIEPLYVKEFDVVEDRENITPISVKIRNSICTGMSTVKVKNVTMNNSNNYNFKMTYSLPIFTFKGMYDAVGQVSLFKINSTGEMSLDTIDGVYTAATKMKLRSHDNIKFFDLKSLQFTVNSIENVRLHFSNLFKDETLNENTNAVFNESWRSFFDIFKPKIEKEIGKVLLEHLRSIFDSVPAHFFISDVEMDSS